MLSSWLIGPDYMTYSHISAPTEFVETNGTRFAYRRFGAGHGVPLLFMPHYRAGMDHWDPAVTDGFAASRPVILFDNAGVAGSSGETPDTMEAMADNAANFLGALGVATVDVLGHSIGGYIAQTLALRHPKKVRRLILAGTGPRAGEPSRDPKVREWAEFNRSPDWREFARSLSLSLFPPFADEPGCGEGVLGAATSAEAGRGPRQHATDNGSPTRGNHRLEQSNRGTERPGRRHHTAGFGRERKSRHHDSDDQFL